MEDQSTTRVFFAIPFNQDIRRHIHYQIEQLKKICPFHVRWVKESQLHLTLRFIGNLSQHQLDALMNTFNVVEDIASFDLELSKIITFPNNKPRIIGVGISLSQALIALNQQLEEKLIYFGLDPEPRTFLPHITLGRIAKPKRKTWLVDKFTSIPPQHVDQISLYQSQLTPDGSIYTLLKTIPLNDAKLIENIPLSIK